MATMVLRVVVTDTEADEIRRAAGDVPVSRWIKRNALAAARGAAVEPRTEKIRPQVAVRPSMPAGRPDLDFSGCQDAETAKSVAVESCRRTGRRIVAKLVGQCLSCGGAIAVGETMLWDGGTRHVLCEACADIPY